jgi:hypothetical protein
MYSESLQRRSVIAAITPQWWIRNGPIAVKIGVGWRIRGQ